MHVNEGKIRNFPCLGEITDEISGENKRNRGNHCIINRKYRFLKKHEKPCCLYRLRARDVKMVDQILLFISILDRPQFSGHQYVADKLMRTAGSRVLIIGSQKHAYE